MGEMDSTAVHGRPGRSTPRPTMTGPPPGRSSGTSSPMPACSAMQVLTSDGSAMSRAGRARPAGPRPIVRTLPQARRTWPASTGATGPARTGSLLSATSRFGRVVLSRQGGRSGQSRQGPGGPVLCLSGQGGLVFCSTSRLTVRGRIPDRDVASLQRVPPHPRRHVHQGPGPGCKGQCKQRAWQ